MSIIKKYMVNYVGTTTVLAGRYKAGLIFEPQNNTIWFNSQPHDHDTLGQIYEKTCPVFNLLGEEYLTRSFLKSAILSKNSTALCTQNWSPNAFSTANINHLVKNLSRDLCLDDSLVINNQGSLLEFTSSSNTKFYLYNYQSGQASDANPRDTDFIMIEGDNFSTASVAYINLASQGSTTANANELKYRGNYSPLYVDTANKKIYWSMQATGYNGTSSYRLRSHVSAIGYSTYTTNEDDGSITISATSNIVASQTAGDTSSYFLGNHIFYAGKNNDGTLMFVENIENTSSLVYPASFSKTNHRIYVTKVNPSTMAVTGVSDILDTSFTTPSSAAKSMYNPGYSPFVNSPLSGEGDIYYSYSPVSTSGDVVSFLKHTWNKSSISYTANNCTMSYPGSNTAADYIANPTPASTYYFGGYRSNCFVTKSGSNYFLNFLQSHGSPTNAGSQTSLNKTLVTYSIGSTNWSNLTYHSSLAITSLEFIYCNTDNTKIAVITPDSAKILDWSSGWSVSASEPGSFYGITQDSLGRFFGIDGSVSDLSTATASSIESGNRPIEHKIRLISSSLPNSVSIAFADASITYSGSNLSKNILVNAYNTSGARIAKSVTLKIEGSNATFTSNSSSTLAATTSTSTDTTIGLTITGPGLINIVGSFTV